MSQTPASRTGTAARRSRSMFCRCQRPCPWAPTSTTAAGSVRGVTRVPHGGWATSARSESSALESCLESAFQNLGRGRRRSAATKAQVRPLTPGPDRPGTSAGAETWVLTCLGAVALLGKALTRPPESSSRVRLEPPPHPRVIPSEETGMYDVREPGGSHEPTEFPKSPKKAAASGWIGSALEYYDFAHLRPGRGPGVPHRLLPEGERDGRAHGSLATYAVGYLARPIGAVVLGHWGDRHGRKNVLVLCDDPDGLRDLRRRAAAHLRAGRRPGADPAGASCASSRASPSPGSWAVPAP